MQTCETLDWFEETLDLPVIEKIAITLCGMVTKDPPSSNVNKHKEALILAKDTSKTVVVEEIFIALEHVIEDVVDKDGTIEIHTIIQQIVARYFLYDLFIWRLESKWIWSVFFAYYYTFIFLNFGLKI